MKVRPASPPEQPKVAQPDLVQSFARAVALHLEGKGEQALAALEGSRAAGADQPAFWAATGYLRHEKGDFEGAAEAYRRLLELDSHHANAAYNLALALHALGKWAEAGTLFESALAADSSRVEAELGLGACRLHLNALAPAMNAFERCLRRDPDLEPALFGRAVALQLQKKLPEAAGALSPHPGTQSQLRRSAGQSDRRGLRIERLSGGCSSAPRT